MPISEELIVKTRDVIGDNDPDSEVWSDDEVGVFIEEGLSEYTYGQRSEGSASTDDLTQGLKLAYVNALLELAKGTIFYFKWRDSGKEVDKTQTPEMCRRLAKTIHDQVMAHRKAKDNKEGENESNTAQGGIMQFDSGDRTPQRDWL